MTELQTFKESFKRIGILAEETHTNEISVLFTEHYRGDRIQYIFNNLGKLVNIVRCD